MQGIKRPHLGEATWRELLARHEAGDESVSAFCRREGLSTNSFRRWRMRLAKVAPDATAGAASRSATAARGFVDLGVLGGTAASAAGRLELRLDLGGGITLHVVRN